MSGRGRGGGNKSNKPGKGKAGRGGGTSRNASSNSTKKSGSNKSLHGHVFDYGTKGAADQMVTTWEQIIIHIGSTLGQDIGSELRNRAPIALPKPTIPQAAQDKHNDFIARHKKAKERLLVAKTNSKDNIAKLLAAAKDLQTINTLSVQLAELEND